MRLLLLTLLLLLTPLTRAETTTAERIADDAAQHELDTSPPNANIPSYQLTPQSLQKGVLLQRSWERRHFLGEAWAVLQLLLLLGTGLVRRMQQAALRFRSRWLQGYVFLLLFLCATTLLTLPLDIYAQWLHRAYGLSVQGWGSWAGDQLKSFALAWALGGLIVMLLFVCIRKLPQTWWFVFWLAFIPITLASIFATPYVIDPLFNHFEPLAQTQPQLAQRLELAAERGHMNIPISRMFLMRASDKTTTLNAYVTGFGSSKRVVVWDTSVAKGTPDQILFIFGHEAGHYVLKHVVRGITVSILGMLVLLYFGYRLTRWTITRFGPLWGIHSQGDWGTLSVLLLIFTCMSIVLEPLSSTMTRSQEHAADIYGQEAIHGLVADPAQTARGAFQVLGETSFDVPNSSQLLEFWTYSHPSTGRRAAFAAHYQPWDPGMLPKYFPR